MVSNRFTHDNLRRISIYVFIMKILDHKSFVFTFGKYKGSSYQEVLSEDPGYIRWCHREIDWFMLSSEEYDNVLDHIRLWSHTGIDPQTEYGLEVYGSDIMY